MISNVLRLGKICVLIIDMQGGEGDTRTIHTLCYLIFDFMIFEFCGMNFMGVVILISGDCQLFCDWNIKIIQGWKDGSTSTDQSV